MSSSGDEAPEFKDLFTQDGVLLKACTSRPISDLNTIGMLCITQQTTNNVKFVEWRPNDTIMIDSETPDQEWAVVNTISRRHRTISGNMTMDYANARSKIIRIPLEELKSFRVTRNNQQLDFSIRHGVWESTFFFQHGNAEVFVGFLKNHLKTAKDRYDRHTYKVIEPNIQSQMLDKSFAELDLFTENTTDMVWNLVSNFKQRPYETTLEAFSKLTDIVYYGGNNSYDKRNMSAEVEDLLSKSMSALEEATTSTKTDEYEVISVKRQLPPRPAIPRGSPLSTEKWDGLRDSEGRILEADGVKQLIFRGGVAHSIRNIVWKYLLDYYKWDMTTSEIKAYQKKKMEEYYSMKLQWRSITEAQESRFSEYRDRKSLVEKDVNRTDRTHNFYAGDNNQNLVTLSDILMTYVMYNFDLGYVQGMSDILAPILLVMGNEVDSFWCFVGFMDKIASNFNMDQADMLSQLTEVHQIISFVCPDFAQYLIQRDSGNMYFCFRWLLVWFKREFSYIDIVKLWEVLWTGLPCANFHLLVAVAILDAEKEVIMNNGYGFTEILKHVNELSMKLDVDSILSAAEGIYHQIISSPHLTNQIRIILGLPTLTTSTNTVTSSESENKETDSATNSNQQANGNRKSEDNEQIFYRPEMEEVVYHIGLDFNF